MIRTIHKISKPTRLCRIDVAGVASALPRAGKYQLVRCASRSDWSSNSVRLGFLCPDRLGRTVRRYECVDFEHIGLAGARAATSIELCIATGKGDFVPQVSLNQGLQRLEIADMQIENELVFAYFDGLPADQRDEQMVRAIQIGVLALKQDRLSAFLAKTTNELGTELESLKILFDMKAEIFAKSTVKGALAEADIADFLTAFLKEEGHKDAIELTGNSAGALARNKTGDILCFVDEDPERKIVIECKFDKGVRLGSIEDQDWYGRRIDSAFSQLVEAQANRGCSHAIIVFDRSSINAALLNRVGNITYHPAFGFIVVVDSVRGDFANLGVAYLVARDLALADRTLEIDTDLLMILMDRIVADANRLIEVRKLVEGTIAQSKQIITTLEQGVLSLDFCRSYLSKFLDTGTLSRSDLHDFYVGGDRREKYLPIADTIRDLF